MVAGSIASLNVTVTAVPVATPVAPGRGLRPMIVGAIVSTVAKVHVASAPRGLPARSVTVPESVT